jgi:hypothetical protein
LAGVVTGRGAAGVFHEAVSCFLSMTFRRRQGVVAPMGASCKTRPG